MLPKNGGTTLGQAHKRRFGVSDRSEQRFHACGPALTAWSVGKSYADTLSVDLFDLLLGDAHRVGRLGSRYRQVEIAAVQDDRGGEDTAEDENASAGVRPIPRNDFA